MNKIHWPAIALIILLSFVGVFFGWPILDLYWRVIRAYWGF